MATQSRISVRRKTGKCRGNGVDDMRGFGIISDAASA